MAFLTTKSTCFLLIITIAFSSSCVVVEGFGVGSLLRGIGKLFHGRKAVPAIKIGADEGLQNLGEAALKTIGEELAGKVFGPSGKTGFRWGWNGSKYYFKVTKKCEEYEGNLTRYCPQKSPDPLPSLLSPGCVAQCVIEFASRSKTDGTPVACTSHNVDSCRYEAENAKCNTGALTQKSCMLINV